MCEFCFTFRKNPWDYHSRQRKAVLLITASYDDVSSSVHRSPQWVQLRKPVAATAALNSLCARPHAHSTLQHTMADGSKDFRLVRCEQSWARRRWHSRMCAAILITQRNPPSLRQTRHTRAAELPSSLCEWNLQVVDIELRHHCGRQSNHQLIVNFCSVLAASPRATWRSCEQL